MVSYSYSLNFKAYQVAVVVVPEALFFFLDLSTLPTF